MGIVIHIPLVSVRAASPLLCSDADKDELARRCSITTRQVCVCMLARVSAACAESYLCKTCVCASHVVCLRVLKDPS